ncbi:TPA: hypothetical protein PRS27_004797 [Escherichia coli]|nr:hypothetical protein [Escherichia coli]
MSTMNKSIFEAGLNCASGGISGEHFFDGDPKLKVGISFIFHSVKYVKKKWRKRLY